MLSFRTIAGSIGNDDLRPLVTRACNKVGVDANSDISTVPAATQRKVVEVLCEIAQDYEYEPELDAKVKTFCEMLGFAPVKKLASVGNAQAQAVTSVSVETKATPASPVIEQKAISQPVETKVEVAPAPVAVESQVQFAQVETKATPASPVIEQKAISQPVETKVEVAPAPVAVESQVQFAQVETKATPASPITEQETTTQPVVTEAEREVEDGAVEYKGSMSSEEMDARAKTMIEASNNLARIIREQQFDMQYQNHQILLGMVLFLYNPAILKEDFADENLIDPALLVFLAAPCWGIVFEYMGVAHLAEYFKATDRPAVENALLTIKKGILDITQAARVDRAQRKAQLTRPVRSLEAKHKNIKSEYEKLTPDAKNIIDVTNLQLKNQGFLGINLPWKEFCHHVLSRFTHFDIVINGSIRVFPASVTMSSKDLPTNPQLKQAGIIVLWSGGFNAPVCMIRQGDDWVQYMLSVGATREQYMRDLYPYTSPRLFSTQSATVALGETKGAITAVVSGTAEVQAAIKETLMWHKPCVVPKLLPQGQDIVFWSQQTEDWMDIIISSSKETVYYQPKHRKKLIDGLSVLHSGDKKDPKSSVRGTNQLQFAYIKSQQTRSNIDRVVYITASAFGAAFTVGPRSLQLCTVPRQAERDLDLILESEVGTGNAHDLQLGNYEKFTQYFTADNQIYNLQTVDPFAGINAYAILVGAVFFSAKHQRNFFVDIGMPLNIKLEAKEEQIINYRNNILNKEILPLLKDERFVASLDTLVAREPTRKLMTGTDFAENYYAYRINSEKLLKTSVEIKPSTSAADSKGDSKPTIQQRDQLESEHRVLQQRLKSFGHFADLTAYDDLDAELARAAGVSPLMLKYSTAVESLSNTTAVVKVHASLSEVRATLFAALPEPVDLSKAGRLDVPENILQSIAAKLIGHNYSYSIKSSAARYSARPSDTAVKDSVSSKNKFLTELAAMGDRSKEADEKISALCKDMIKSIPHLVRLKDDKNAFTNLSNQLNACLDEIDTTEKNIVRVSTAGRTNNEFFRLSTEEEETNQPIKQALLLHSVKMLELFSDVMVTSIEKAYCPLLQENAKEASNQLSSILSGAGQRLIDLLQCPLVLQEFKGRVNTSFSKNPIRNITGNQVYTQYVDVQRLERYYNLFNGLFMHLTKVQNEKFQVEVSKILTMLKGIEKSLLDDYAYLVRQLPAPPGGPALIPAIGGAASRP